MRVGGMWNALQTSGIPPPSEPLSRKQVRELHSRVPHGALRGATGSRLASPGWRQLDSIVPNGKTCANAAFSGINLGTSWNIPSSNARLKLT